MEQLYPLTFVPVYKRKNLGRRQDPHGAGQGVSRLGQLRGNVGGVRDRRRGVGRGRGCAGRAESARDRGCLRSGAGRREDLGEQWGRFSAAGQVHQCAGRSVHPGAPGRRGGPPRRAAARENRDVVCVGRRSGSPPGVGLFPADLPGGIPGVFPLGTSGGDPAPRTRPPGRLFPAAGTTSSIGRGILWPRSSRRPM